MEEELIFQEDEVVWAKIRGYPWWPAYISELHQRSQKEIQYTVVFFGDNTNARLDGSKLRKFIENYIECYLKAKTHRKLMTSIMMAEQKLKQNDQPVSVFQQLRGRIKDKKAKPRFRDLNESASNILESGQGKNSKKESEMEIFQENEEAVDFEKPTKSKQREVERGETAKRSKLTEKESVKKQKEKIKGEESRDLVQSKEQSEQHLKKGQLTLQKSVQDSKQIVSQRKSSITREVDIVIDIKAQHSAQKEQLQHPIVVQFDSKEHESSKIVPVKLKTKGKESVSGQGPSKKQKKIQVSKQQGKDKEKWQSLVVPELQRSKTEVVSKKIQNEGNKEIIFNKKMEIRDDQLMEDQEELAEAPIEFQQDVGKAKEIIRSASAGQTLNRIQRPVGRKRGRPRKVEKIQPESEDEYKQLMKPEPVAKRKAIRKVIIPPKQIQKPKGISIVDQTVINGVQRLLQNREGLIEFLSHASITVGNVKQILDMDVSNILQEGPLTEQVIHLLQLLRAALLFKYFPQDMKHKKKYQKLLKRKILQPEQQQQKELPREKSQLRKKTLMKVKKFLLGLIDNEGKLQEVAEKIEDYLFKSDSGVGQRYCKIAFLVLSALKQKKESYQQIMKKLESRLYD